MVHYQKVLNFLLLSYLLLWRVLLDQRGEMSPLWLQVHMVKWVFKHWVNDAFHFFGIFLPILWLLFTDGNKLSVKQLIFIIFLFAISKLLAIRIAIIDSQLLIQPFESRIPLFLSKRTFAAPESEIFSLRRENRLTNQTAVEYICTWNVVDFNHSRNVRRNELIYLSESHSWSGTIFLFFRIVHKEVYHFVIFVGKNSSAILLDQCEWESTVVDL